jgi:hypothetical protein
MAPTKRRVSFPGIIRGQGHEATCTVWATETSQDDEDVHYGEYSIDNASVSKVLPEGTYELSVNGEPPIPVRRGRYGWQAA